MKDSNIAIWMASMAIAVSLMTAVFSYVQWSYYESLVYRYNIRR